MRHHHTAHPAPPQGDARFRRLGRGVPKGQTTTAACMGKDAAILASDSGSLFSVSLATGMRSPFSQHTAHSAPVCGLVQGRGAVAALSVDTAGLLVAWDSAGAVLASSVVATTGTSGPPFLTGVSEGDCLAVLVDSQVRAVTLTQGAVPDLACVTLANTAVLAPTAVSAAGGGVVWTDAARSLHAVALPRSSGAWEAEVCTATLPSPARTVHATVSGDGVVAVLATTESGRVLSVDWPSLGASLGVPRSMDPPGHVSAAFWASPALSSAAAVFGAAGAPVPGTLSLGALGAVTATGSSLPMSGKRRQSFGALHASVADLVPANKRSRGDEERPLGERLASLAANAATASGSATNTDATVLAGGDGGALTSSVTLPLVQALAAGDDTLLERCLSASNSQEAIAGTVAALSGADALKLLSALMAKFDRRPTRGAHLLKWMNAVLHSHAGSLMTVPDLSSKLMVLYQAVNQRMATFKKLLRLQGRLDLLLSHAAAGAQG